MKTFTYSEARQRFANVLDLARRDGRVQIRRRDGQVFVLQPATTSGSPLDVPGVPLRLPSGETATWLKASRDESASRVLDAALSNKRVQLTPAPVTPLARTRAASKKQTAASEKAGGAGKRRARPPLRGGRGRS